MPTRRSQKGQVSDETKDGEMHDAVPAIAAVGASPLVRIADTQPWMIKSKHVCYGFQRVITDRLERST